MQCSECGHENAEQARFCNDCGASLTQRPPPTAGTLAAGRYKVDRLLGEGTRKRVYLAHDDRLGRDVAVAVIKTEGLDAAGRSRIDREARAMARLGDHPNVVTVFDVVEENGAPLIIAQFMDGGTLAERLAAERDGRLPIPDVVRIGEELALALAHAHGLGIVHRDVKPANVWLTAAGAARLGDFGLAAMTDQSRLTTEGMVVGTVAYLAPEQAVGRPPQAASDLYALGAVLYELTTGRPPFLGDDAVAVIAQHLNAAPVATTWHNPQVPTALDALIGRLLAKDPSDRPSNAGEVAAELRRIQRSSFEPVAAADLAASTPLAAAAWQRFVGRTDELHSARTACDEALAGRSRLVMVVGEPGIGKTRLVEEVAAYAGIRGAQVCWGHCYDGEVGLPYLPFVEAFRSYVRRRSDDELRADLTVGGPEVATLVSEVRERVPQIPKSPPLEGDAERLRLFDGVTTFLAHASRTDPIVLVLDDLHWADTPTLLLLQYLARNLRNDRILVVGTYRDVDLDRQHPLADAIATLRRERLYERILLRGMSRDDVKALIEAVGEQETPDAFADTIFRLTEGNPFFVAEVLRHLGETGALRLVDGRWVGTPESIAENLPEGVREVIGRRLSRLSDDANRMLTVAAAMPGGFTPDIVARVADAEEDVVLDVLDEALASQIVRERPRAPGAYEFTHALIRQTLYGELSTPRRVRLHRQIGEALEAVAGPTSDAALPELAYHWFQAAAGGAIGKAVEYSTRAGDRARDHAAHEEAARSYDQALQALELDEHASPQQRAELLVSLIDALSRAGDVDRAEVALHELGDLSASLDDGAPFARAVVAMNTARVVGVLEPGTVALIEQALEGLDQSHATLRSRLLSQLSALYLFFDVDRQRECADAALAAARESGDPLALARAVQVHAWRYRPDDPEYLEALYEQQRLAEESHDRDLLASVSTSFVIHAMLSHDADRLDRSLARVTAQAEESRSPRSFANAAMIRVCVAVLRGQYAAADADGAAMLEAARRLRDRSLVNSFGIAVMPMWREQQRLDPLIEPTRAALDDSERMAAWRAGLAQALALVGRRAEAEAELEHIAVQGFDNLPENVARPYTLIVLAETAVLVGATEHLDALTEQLALMPGVGTSLGPTAYHGVTDRALGLLAGARGDSDAAVEHHERAIALHDRLGARPWSARSRYDLAGALVARDGDGDAARAFGLVNEALETAHEIGMPALVEEALAVKLDLQGVASGSLPDHSIDALAASVSVERPDLRSHSTADGRITLLFSDIEGYSSMNDRLGDVTTQHVLRAHNELLRTAVAAAGGTEVKSQGDGFMLVFDEPTRALECALAVQRSIGAHDFGAEVDAVRVRMGLHTGLVIRERDDFFGRTVILAARVADAADGGEILVTNEVRDLVGDACRFDGGREVSLKGLSGTTRVYAVDQR